MGYGVVSAPSEGPGIGGGIMGMGDVEPPTRVTFYVGVDDVTEYLDKAASMGGSVIMPEMEVMDDVVIGIFADPEGQVIGLVKNVPM